MPTTKTAATARIEAEAEKLKGELSPRQLAELARLIDPRGVAGEMTADEYRQFVDWLALRAPRGFSSDSIEAGRLFFVQGASVSEVVQETGMTQQYTSRLIARLRKYRDEAAQQTGELSPEQFQQFVTDQAAAGGRRPYSDKAIEAARLVLVEGVSPSNAAELTGQSRQAVSQLLARIRRRLESAPTGWVKVEQWLPGAVAEQIEKLAQDLKANPDSDSARLQITFGHR